MSSVPPGRSSDATAHKRKVVSSSDARHSDMCRSFHVRWHEPSLWRQLATSILVILFASRCQVSIVGLFNVCRFSTEQR